MHRIVRSNRIIKKTSRFLRRSSKFETEKNASREKIRDVSARRWKGASKSRDEIRLWWWWGEGGIYEPQLHALWRESKEEGGLGNLVDDLGEEVDCDIRRSSKSIHRNIRARFLKSCGLKTPRVTTPFRLHRSSDYTRINKCSRCSTRFVSTFPWDLRRKTGSTLLEIFISFDERWRIDLLDLISTRWNDVQRRTFGMEVYS